MRGTYDAVLIGAGHNALACAAHLAHRGWSVAVFEQAAEPGGAVRSGEYTLPGFRHDWGAMNLSLFAGSGFHARHAEELRRHGLEFAPVADCFATAWPDGRWIGVSTDLEATAARIAAFSPRDAETWRRLAAAFPAAAAPILGLMGRPMGMRAIACFLRDLLRGGGFSGAGETLRFLLRSPRDWLTETFESPELHAMLAAWGMHLDFAPDIAGGALFPYLEGMANQNFGMVLGRGGADCMIRALCGMLAARGGELHCNAPVTRILRRGNRAVGIRLADGTEIAARRAVIAGVAPRALPGLLGAAVSRPFDRAMERFRHAPGTMMIHLALSDLPAWPDPALRRFAYVHLAPDLDSITRAYSQALGGLLPEAPAIVVGQPTAIDPSRAPEGRHILWLQVRMAPGRIRGDAAGRIAATDWAEAAEPFAERALDILDRHAPGIRDRILGRRVFSPADLEAWNPNLVGGDQIGGSHHLAQNFLFRPAWGHADGSTPVAGLHMVGASVWPGAGV
ncbi:MAG: NAD(P)/FAD-dependent oxidoreductase, partial [Alphaproteobacteria bacterium]